MALLSINGLDKSFGGVVALSGVDFDVNEGELVALIGPNGAGKSTCFNVVNGQLRPDAGSVRLRERELVGLTPRAIWRLGVGRTFQIAATFRSMTVLENVQTAFVSRHRRGLSVGPLVKRLYVDDSMAILERVGMHNQAHRPCGILAYGDLKKIELAIALAHRPALLLMDEPTAGMSPRERVDLMELTAGIVRDEGCGVLFTEHDMDVVFGHADRVVVLHRGEVLAVGTPSQVRDNAEVQQTYLGGGTLDRKQGGGGESC